MVIGKHRHKYSGGEVITSIATLAEAVLNLMMKDMPMVRLFENWEHRKALIPHYLEGITVRIGAEDVVVGSGEPPKIEGDLLLFASAIRTLRWRIENELREMYRQEGSFDIPPAPSEPVSLHVYEIGDSTKIVVDEQLYYEDVGMVPVSVWLKLLSERAGYSVMLHKGHSGDWYGSLK